MKEELEKVKAKLMQVEPVLRSAPSNGPNDSAYAALMEVIATLDKLIAEQEASQQAVVDYARKSPCDRLSFVDMGARERADAFIQMWGRRLAEVDHGLMLDWFWHAIMAGYDEAKRQSAQALTQLIHIALTNPADLRGFIEANYRKEFERWGGEAEPVNAERQLFSWLVVAFMAAHKEDVPAIEFANTTIAKFRPYLCAAPQPHPPSHIEAIIDKAWNEYKSRRLAQGKSGCHEYSPFRASLKLALGETAPQPPADVMAMLDSADIRAAIARAMDPYMDRRMRNYGMALDAVNDITATIKQQLAKGAV